MWPQVVGCDADVGEDKRRQIPFSEVESLSLSFRKLARITNLPGLDSLTKLQLDNNRITKIENIRHLVRYHVLFTRPLNTRSNSKGCFCWLATQPAQPCGLGGSREGSGSQQQEGCRSLLLQCSSMCIYKAV